MRDWKCYPFTPEWGDPSQFTFPACDGFRADHGITTYFLDGFLQGASTDRRYAFLAIFADGRFWRQRLRLSLHTFALFDCDSGVYGTSTDYDLPSRPWPRSAYKLSLAADRLGLSFDGAHGVSRWECVLAAADRYRPFAWQVELHGRDASGNAMRLELEIDAQRPPAPVGGSMLGGEMMFLGAPRTYSYFQTGLRMRGRLSWGDIEEDVSGDIGWIDRRWAGNSFADFQDLRGTRYRSEWRTMQFDDGWDMSCLHQYLRPQRNALVPWTGITAQGPGPDYESLASHRVELTIPRFVKSPGIVRSRLMLTDGPRYFPDRYRLSVPEWEFEVESEPLVSTPAHDLPVECWAGPVVLRGRHRGREIVGVGFDQRDRPWCRDFELARALRLTVDHLHGADADVLRLLSCRAAEVEALCLRGPRRDAALHFRNAVEPLIAGLPTDARGAVEGLASDLASLL